jgi:hypothetical protein
VPLRERLVRWPDAAPRWSRGPGAVLAAAAAAAAVGGGLAAHHGAAVVDQRVADRTALVSLSVGAVQVHGMHRLPTRERDDVERDGGAGPRGAGWADASAEVTLVNRGDRAVTVRVGGLSGPAQLGPVASPDDARVVVPAGSTEVAHLPLEVDCAVVPPVPATGTGGPAGQRDWVDASVTVAGSDDPARRVRLPVTQLGPSTTDQLAWGCDPRGGRSVAAVPVAVRDDGALVLLVENTSGRATTLVPSAARGVALRADPPLPARLPPDRSSVVTLAVDVDCARAGDALELAHGVDLLVSSARDPVGLGGGYPVVDPETMSAWVAGEVSARCR